MDGASAAGKPNPQTPSQKEEVMGRTHEWLATAGLVLATVACGRGGSLTGPSTPALSTGTYTVSGWVYESGGGGDQPSRGAQIMVVSSSGTRSGTTGLDGGYTLEGVPGGPARIVARKARYEEESQAAQITQNVSFTFRLRPDDFNNPRNRKDP